MKRASHRARLCASGALLVTLAILGPGVEAQQPAPATARPWVGVPVQFFETEVEGQRVRMAYRELAAARAPAAPARAGVVMLLHGKNFSGLYFESTMRALADAGYRVVAPDQVGFGDSSRPDIHYSFHELARLTAALLDHLGVDKIHVLGHSMGGMLAVRFALLYPERVVSLVLENPIGLEDYRALVPYTPLEEQERRELSTTRDRMLAYQKGYYVKWRPELERFVEDQARWLGSGEWPRIARASALTYEMIYLQPVVYELPRVRVPTLLIIGQSDRTVVGKERLPADLRAVAGQYPTLGRHAQAAIAGARLVEIPGCGHIPHLEAFPEFFAALEPWLRGLR